VEGHRHRLRALARRLELEQPGSFQGRLIEAVAGRCRRLGDPCSFDAPLCVDVDLHDDDGREPLLLRRFGIARLRIAFERWRCELWPIGPHRSGRSGVRGRGLGRPCGCWLRHRFGHLCG
jgi:hypothetical protein